MAELYDVIIVGASQAGISAYNYLHKNSNLKILVVSSNFQNTSVHGSIFKIDRLQHKVIYAEYRYGITTLILDDNSRVCGKYIIIATGTKPKKLNLENSADIYYKLKDIKLRSKDAPIIVVGSNEMTANFALALADKYNHIYVCCPDQRLHCGKELGLQVYWSKNIAFLPLCEIKSCKVSKAGKLSEVELSTYEKIKCKAILVSADRIPDETGFPATVVPTDAEGYVIVNHKGQTKLIPSIYAIGECVKNANSEIEVARNIINEIK